MKPSERKALAKHLGKIITRNKKDAWGQLWAYRVSPAWTGSTCYLSSLAAVDRLLLQVKQMRDWQAEMPPIGE